MRRALRTLGTGLLVLVVAGLSAGAVLAAAPTRTVEEVHISDTFPAGDSLSVRSRPDHRRHPRHDDLHGRERADDDDVQLQERQDRLPEPRQRQDAHGRAGRACGLYRQRRRHHHAHDPGQRPALHGARDRLDRRQHRPDRRDARHATGAILSIDFEAGHQDGTPFPALCVGLGVGPTLAGRALWEGARPGTPMPDTAAVTQPETAPSPTVKLVSGPAFELVAELAAFASGPCSRVARVRQDLDLGCPAAGRPGSASARRALGVPAVHGARADRARRGRSVRTRGLVEALRRHPADALRRRLLGAESPPNRAMVSDGAFDRALAGNRRARAELRRTLGLNPPARQSIDRLLTTDPESVQDEIVVDRRGLGFTGLPDVRGCARMRSFAATSRRSSAVPRRARGRGAPCVDERRRVRSRRLGDRDHPHPDRRAPPVHRAGRVGLEAAHPVFGRRRGVRRRSGRAAPPPGQGHRGTRGRAAAADPP